MDKSLFSTRGSHARAADAVNLAGGKVYALGPREALAQLSVTGCFGDIYYASARNQVDEAKRALSQNTSEFVAKCANYARQRGNMKDMPAFMLAYLAGGVGGGGERGDARRARFVELFGELDFGKSERYRAAFASALPRVIDNGKMLRNFVQVIRSGELGRRSLDS